MRTSYDRSGNASKKSPLPNNEDLVVNQEVVRQEDDANIRAMIIQGISSAKDSLDAKIMESNLFNNPVTSTYPPTTPQPTNKAPVKKTTKKSSKKWVIWLVVGIFVLALATVGILFATEVIEWPFSSETPEATEKQDSYKPQKKAISKVIEGLYSDGDIREGLSTESLASIRSMLEDAKEHDEDVSKLEVEVNTISAYLRDREALEVFEGADYDLAPDTLTNDLLRLKASADEYSVDDLKDKIYARVDSLVAMREEYLRIKASLLGVSDLLSFNSETYSKDISAITHTVNVEELQLLLAKVSADSEVARAEVYLVNAEDVEEATKRLTEARSAQEKATNDWLAFTGEVSEEFQGGFGYEDP